MTDYTKRTDHDLVQKLAEVSAAVGSASVYVSAYMDERQQAREIAEELVRRLKELRRYASHLNGCLWEERQPNGGKLCDCGVIELLHPGDPRAVRR